MLLISGAVRFTQELRAKRVADRLTGMIASTVLVRRNGAWVRCSSTELVVGDLVRLSAGDRVPADIRLTAAKDLFVSQSVITGESEILEKTAGTLSPTGTAPTPDTEPCLYGLRPYRRQRRGRGAGCRRGHRLRRLCMAESSRKHGFDQGANSIAWVLIRFMAVLIPVVLIACSLTKGDWVSAFLFALSVAVGLTPEMLPMVINACLAKGSAAMGKKQTVVKNINAMQGFGSMDILCVDKTGTLTGDQITLEYYMDILATRAKRCWICLFEQSLSHRSGKSPGQRPAAMPPDAGP